MNQESIQSAQGFYEARPSAYFDDEWIVDYTDPATTHALAFFHGPNAEALAREYAAWKNSQDPALERGPAPLAL